MVWIASSFSSNRQSWCFSVTQSEAKSMLKTWDYECQFIASGFNILGYILRSEIQWNETSYCWELGKKKSAFRFEYAQSKWSFSDSLSAVLCSGKIYTKVSRAKHQLINYGKERSKEAPFWKCSRTLLSNNFLLLELVAIILHPTRIPIKLWAPMGWAA